MKLLATLFVLMFGGAALAVDPTLEIAATGTTNNNNKVVITFEIKNPGANTISFSAPVAQLKVSGNVVAPSTYTVQAGRTTGTITITGQLAAGSAPVYLKVNLTGGATVEQTKNVDFQMSND